MSATENTFSAILGEETTDAINDYLTNHQKDKQYIMAVAQTGKGKSWYVKNKLYDYCKERGFKILYLLPRKVVKEEFILELKGNDEGEIDKTDVIKVYTYQQIERLDRWVSPQQFNIIICDECHYFISDSFFNVRTERSYNRLLEYAPDAAFLFITATPKPIEAVLDFDLHERDKKLCTGSIKPDFSIIKEIRFISADSPKQKDENVQRILESINETEDEAAKDIFNNLPNGEKAIVFCDSAKYAYQLHKQYPDDSMFICSEYNKKYASKINKEKYKEMLQNHYFDCKYVFCTSALDVGFSIKDLQVKHIICLLWDWNGIVQAIGRKRMLTPDDTITVYLKNYTNYSIGGLMTTQKRNMEHYNFFTKYGAEKYLEQYEKVPDPAKIIYYKNIGNGLSRPEIDNFVKWDNFEKNWMLYQINNIDDTKMKYKNWVRKQFGMPPLKERASYGIEKDLKEFAESGRIFTKDDKYELINVIAYKDSHGRLISGIPSLNEYLEKLKIKYRIMSKRDYNENKRKVTIYWVEKI